jgi:hypothetical protein
VIKSKRRLECRLFNLTKWLKKIIIKIKKEAVMKMIKILKAVIHSESVLYPVENDPQIDLLLDLGYLYLTTTKVGEKYVAHYAYNNKMRRAKKFLQIISFFMPDTRRQK